MIFFEDRPSPEGQFWRGISWGFVFSLVIWTIIALALTLTGVL